MIVVVGNRHDAVAADLVQRWPQAAWCDAGDLVAPGWCWSTPAGDVVGERRWVIDRAVVPDAEVTGVLVRRAAVHPDELVGTHPDDRAYLAAEALAMLVYVLATTTALVVNPVRDGTLGVDALRPERWMPVAAGLGVAVAPVRVTSEPSPVGGRASRGGPRSVTDRVVEVVAGVASTAGDLGAAAVAVADALGLAWAVAGFDVAGRLSTLTTTPAPSPEAAGRLGTLLSGTGRGAR